MVVLVFAHKQPVFTLNTPNGCYNMLDTLSTVGSIFTGPAWILVLTLTLIIVMFAKASRNPTSKIDWEQLFIDTHTDKTSPYRVGYLVGMIVGTWVTLVYADRGNLPFDLFGMYLAYLLGGSTLTAYLQKKQSSEQPPDSDTPPKTTE